MDAPKTGEPNRERVGGRLLVGDRVVPGWVEVAGGRITGVRNDAAMRDGPFVAPGFIDIHLHGAGGASALDAGADSSVLDAMAAVLVRHGVTAFVPAAVAAPMPELVAFAEGVRRRMAMPAAPDSVAEVLGFHLEGPFLSPSRSGAHVQAALAIPASVARDDLRPLLDGLRRITIAPELPGALELIAWFAAEGVEVSLGHSNATLEEARAGFAAGATSATHLFNAMSGFDHHAPGLAAAGLADDDITVELIGDGLHVHPSLLPLVFRMKPPGHVVLVSDALAPAGTTTGADSDGGIGGQTKLGGLAVTVRAGRATIAGTDRLAGSVLLLDGAVRTVVAAGVSVAAAVAAVTRCPAALLGLTDRGRLAPGQRADLVVLDNDLGISAVMRAGRWIV